MLNAQDTGLSKDSVVLLEQVRTIDKHRLKERMGRLDNTAMNQVNQALSISFGLDPNDPVSYTHLKGVQKEAMEPYLILSDGKIHMARMAIFATHSTNGVAKIHTGILKNAALHEWYLLYPERFNNKTNGITQRRWLSLCNPELAGFITGKIGAAWITDLNKLKALQQFADNPEALAQFAAVSYTHLDVYKRQSPERTSGFPL